METNEQFNLLRQKLKHINSAIFFNYSESPLRLPSSIVLEVFVDADAHAWFFAEKLNKLQTIADENFPVRLEFYRKQADCLVQVDGIASIIEDEGAMNHYFLATGKQRKDEGMVLLKVKIQQAFYRDISHHEQMPAWQQWWTLLKEYFGYLPHRLRQGYVSLS